MAKVVVVVRALGNPLAASLQVQVLVAKQSPSALAQENLTLQRLMALVEERPRQYPQVKYLLVDRKVEDQEPKYLEIGLSFI